MVGRVAASMWRDRAWSLVDSVRSGGEIPSKMKQLRQLKEVLLRRDPSLLPLFVSRIAELRNDRDGPVRKFVAELIGEIGLKNPEFLPEMIPCLISFLKDETPAVARQAIITGTSVYQFVLEKIAVQGLHSSSIDESLESSWAWMLNFKSSVLPMANQHSSDGVRLLAVRFVETLVILYTPDPNVSSDPPEEAGHGFNISWLKGGHPLLNVGDLATEASHCLGLLLDQLRSPQIKKLSNSIIIVLINSLSAIAVKRPSFYGRILSVLLNLDPATSKIKAVRVPGAHYALKNAFLSCLKCTHSSAEPWRARMLEALETINSGESADQEIEFRSSGGNCEKMEDLLIPKDEKMTIDETNKELSCKRRIDEENRDSSEEHYRFGKRTKQEPSVVQDTGKETYQSSTDSIQNSPVVSGPASSSDNNSGPVQQLVSMFCSLVAQGEKAAASLEILIASISSDLLAEVVMTNIQNLPPTCPQADEDDNSSKTGHTSDLTSFVAPTASPVASDIQSLSSLATLLTSSLLDVRTPSSHDVSKTQVSDEEKISVSDERVITTQSMIDGSATTSAGLITSVDQHVEKSTSVVPLQENIETGESIIPGLDSTNSSDEVQESQSASHSSTAENLDSSQDHAISLSSISTLNVSSAAGVASIISETQSTGVAIEANEPSSTTSGIVPQYALPKMTLLDVSLTDEDKDQIQTTSFLRILESLKQIIVSGGSDARFSLLAHLGIEFPLELDAWGLLKKHVLSDYINHEGHELTLRILYRLYRDTEQDQDFLSSRTAISVYETFLLAIAESLRDTFPASDKSLSRLLAEVPYLPEGVLKLLECLCSPDITNKQDMDFQSGDRVTQGLSTVWSLILLRTSNRDRCLQIALQSAVHRVEEVRMKAIRLVANKLFPMPRISQKIEDFAIEKLQSVVSEVPLDYMGTDESTSVSSKVVHQPSSDGQQLSSLPNNESASSSSKAPSLSPSLISEARQSMSLYFALCTKKHSLLRKIFVFYGSMSKAAKEAVHGHMPILVRTIGSSSELLGIISDPPAGSEGLLMQVVQTLIDGAVPSQDLISSVKKLYHSINDIDFLIPVLLFLSKDEILSVMPNLVNLPQNKFKAALARLLQGSAHAGPSLTPAEILIAIHGIDPEKCGIPLKKVMDACSACFEQNKVFTQQVLAKVLNQLVEQTPLPLLFMRTVLQAIGVFPALVDFVMEIMSRLVSKQIWKNPKLWVGFLKCAAQTIPQSFSVLLQLPATQLENALSRNPVLKPHLVEHAGQQNIRSTLPRSTLVVLGLVQDSQASSQAQQSSQSQAQQTSQSRSQQASQNQAQQTSQSQATDTGSSAADVTTEVTQGSSAVS